MLGNSDFFDQDLLLGFFLRHNERDEDLDSKERKGSEEAIGSAQRTMYPEACATLMFSLRPIKLQYADVMQHPLTLIAARRTLVVLQGSRIR